MAIIRCFEEWRAHLEGSGFPIKVLTDHKNLEYFMSTKLLNRRQARWSEFLSRFNFEIVYRPGKVGGKPDALTRRSGDLPEEGDERLLENQQAVLKLQNLPENMRLLASNTSTNGRPPLDSLFKEAYEADTFPERILAMLAQNEQHSKEISLADCDEKNSCLRYQECWYVPDHDPLRL